jgi:hypothetical protein
VRHSNPPIVEDGQSGLGTVGGRAQRVEAENGNSRRYSEPSLVFLIGSEGATQNSIGQRQSTHNGLVSTAGMTFLSLSDDRSVKRNGIAKLARVLATQVSVIEYGLGQVRPYER